MSLIEFEVSLIQLVAIESCFLFHFVTVKFVKTTCLNTELRSTATKEYIYLYVDYVTALFKYIVEWTADESTVYSTILNTHTPCLGCD